MPSLLKVRLSLKGRPIRSFTFDKETVSIGRDPSADIFLDNTGVSRQHAQIARTAGGFLLEDLGSANGTFLNEMAVTRELLGNDDVVRIGKFHLWVGLDSDRRDQLLAAARPSSDTFRGTMVLSAEQVVELTRKAKAGEAKARASQEPARTPTPLSRGFAVAVIVAFALGVLLLGAASVLRALR
jgi:pSer/pThr/pTyr-binding forkhead associated (FHA) protein